MDVIIGGNIFRNTDGAVLVEGVPQVEFALKQPTGPLLVNFALFDESGKIKAKIVDSSMMFNEAGAYELSRTDQGLLIKRKANDKVVLRAEVKEPNRVTVSEAEFVTAKGHVLEVSAVEWKIGGTRAAQGDEDLKGGSIEIG